MGTAAKWLFSEPIPEEIAEKKSRSARPESAKGCDLVFSALPSEVAKDIEPTFATSRFCHSQ